MPISFYNTLTKRIDPFEPLVPGRVGMYTCGPTVYDYFHIGNARSFVMADVIRRYLTWRGYEVTFVMNITDIDDRIIQRANDRGVAAADVAGEYTAAFLHDIARLGILPASIHPCATENVEGIIAHIAGLVDAGAAYELEGDVYFSIDAFPDYGRLSGKNLDDLQAGARVEADSRKRNPMDFALWKAMKPGEPFWESPWGRGRPGWHIECSVMSLKHLGRTFDIHAGGNDLIFPHHENEIAQSEALTHQPFARYWLHFGFLNIDNEKMSKSLGNFFTTRDILDKVSAEALRFLYLQTHYRSPLNFTSDGLEGSTKGLQKLTRLMRELTTATPGTGSFDVTPHVTRFTEHGDNDLNFPAALGVLFELARDVMPLLSDGRGLDAASLSSVRDFVQSTAGGVFGILAGRSDEADSGRVARLMDVLITVRKRARADRNWAFSDLIRDELLAIGIRLEDGKEGTTWKVDD